MAPSDDQVALLRLLLAGDTYEQVAEVLGSTPDEVRRRAQDAASKLEGDRDPQLPVEQVSARLAALEGPAHEPTAAATARTSRLPQRWPLWGALGLVVVVAAVVILVVSGGGEGGGDEGTTTGATADREDVVPIELTPVSGSSARGRIAVVRVSGDQPALDLALANLRPSGRGQTYVLWFVGAGGRSLPVAFRAVGSDGRLTGRAAIPTSAIGLLPSFDTALLTLAEQRQASAAIRRAAQSDTLPTPVGVPVMRGALRQGAPS
jgi:hypothetical protein